MNIQMREGMEVTFLYPAQCIIRVAIHDFGHSILDFSQHFLIAKSWRET